MHPVNADLETSTRTMTYFLANMICFPIQTLESFLMCSISTFLDVKSIAIPKVYEKTTISNRAERYTELSGEEDIPSPADN
jgi:hypothetical protein